MEITRTTKIKIDLPLDIAQRTLKAYANACNYASQVAFAIPSIGREPVHD